MGGACSEEACTWRRILRRQTNMPRQMEAIAPMAWWICTGDSTELEAIRTILERIYSTCSSFGQLLAYQCVHWMGRQTWTGQGRQSSHVKRSANFPKCRAFRHRYASTRWWLRLVARSSASANLCISILLALAWNT